MSNFDLEKLPCSSDAIKQHILRVYFQCYLWKMSAFIEFPALDPINYGYNDDGRILMPVMYCKEELPVDYPGPCSCILSKFHVILITFNFGVYWDHDVIINDVILTQPTTLGQRHQFFRIQHTVLAKNTPSKFLALKMHTNLKLPPRVYALCIQIFHLHTASSIFMWDINMFFFPKQKEATIFHQIYNINSYHHHACSQGCIVLTNSFIERVYKLL